jgi:flagellar motor switch protein FliG
MENNSLFKKEYPFAQVFKCLSPKDFAYVFCGEAAQTIAFVLSFSRNGGYIKKVLKILNNEDTTEIVAAYLRKVSEEGADPEFIKKIEAHLERSARLWKSLTSLRHSRKNIFVGGKMPAGK